VILTTARVPGHPGVFLAPPPILTTLRPERLDIVGFVGVAPRGPVDEPVRIGRWSDYESLFGGFEPAPGGPVRLLPYAVATFFRQGGQVAYVVRVAPHGEDAGGSAAATAHYQFDLPAGDFAGLSAADEGAWGGELRLRLLYRVAQHVRGEVESEGALQLPPGTAAPVGSLLRLIRPGSSDVALRWVASLGDRLPRGSTQTVRLDGDPLAAGSIDVDVVTGSLQIDDLARPGAGEVLTGLGLRPAHPRWIQAVLSGRSSTSPTPGSPTDRHLVAPIGDWTDLDLTPAPSLMPLVGERTQDGADRSHLIDAGAFFDPEQLATSWIDEDAGPDDRDPHVGVDRMGRVREIGLLCVPDITWNRYVPTPLPPVRHPRAPLGCRCHACTTADDPEPEFLAAPAEPRDLDARNPGDLADLVSRQVRIVDVARARERFVALLDVPNGLSTAQIAQWRSHFDSSYAAAYHPWLAVAGGPGGRALPIPPSAFAAGIIAARELERGLPWGPANELARDAVRAEATVTDAAHDALHQLGVNVYRAERDGFRLTAARTLSTDPDYRQLSVRRLMTMLRLTVQRQGADLAFEPNTAELRDRLTRMLTTLLRGLARQGAFAGRSDAESFFVHCGDDVNPPASQALGRLIAEIGVAPAVPLEYILVRIARDPDGSLTVVRDER
jgi:hypothetical protein